MAYQVTAEQARSISDVENAFGTVRLLPAWEDIPEQFKKGNIYTRVAEALFHGSPIPASDIELHNGLQPKYLRTCITAHLRSWSPKHAHKIAGVGYMLSKLATLHPQKEMPNR